MNAMNAMEPYLPLARQISAAATGDQLPGVCPGCEGSDWVRDGLAQRRRGGPVQVFRCRGCGKKRVGRSDSPFKHPLFPPEVMVVAVLMRRDGLKLQAIADRVGTLDEDGVARRPNRQTVARWLKRLTRVVERHLPEVSDTPAGDESPVQADLDKPRARVDETPTPATPGGGASGGGHVTPGGDGSGAGDRDNGGLCAHRFELLEALSGDRQAGVFVARDAWAEGDERVVIKIVRTGPLDYEREFALRTRLNHPNICGVREFGQLAGGRCWFSQDRIEGQDLFDAAQGASFERVLEWMVGVLRGCAYLHGRGVLHRDLKPENILIDAAQVPRIVDFGISVEAGGARGGDGPSGSLGYLAPEVLEGAAPEPTLDLYAVAAAFHHVLLRELPDPPQPLPPLAGRRPEVPDWFDAILARMTEPDPRRRFQSAVAVIDAIVARSGIRFARETRRTLAARIEGAALLGRDVALARVDELVENGGSVWVCGPAGIGKTRLVEAWRRRRQLEGGAVVEGPLSAILAAVTTRLGTGHPLLRQHADVIVRLTGAGGDSPLPASVRDGIYRDREALLELVSAGLPPDAVVVVDDLGRADEPTFALVGALLAMGRVPVLFAGRAPEGARAAQLAAWERGLGLTRITLRALSQEAVRALIEDAFDGSAFAAGLAARVHRATEGNPRFVEEVLRGLVEQGAVRRDSAGEWVADASSIPVPSALVDACGARIEALEVAERETLRLLAVAEGPVPQRAAEGLEGFSGLVARALVRNSEGAVAPTHEALGRAALDGVGEAGKRRLRLALVAVLEERLLPRERPPELLGRLLDRAGDGERAAPYLHRAAVLARERWEVPAALAGLQRVDALLDAATWPAPAGLRQQILRALARMLRYSGRQDELAVCLDRLSLLAQLESDTALMHEAAALKALYWFDRGRAGLSKQIVAGHLASARDTGDPVVAARFLWVLAMVARNGGQPERGVELSDEVLELLADQNQPEALELRVQNYINRGNAFGQTGRLDRAVSSLERALTLGRQHGLVSAAIVATMNLGICHAMQCRFGPALDHFDRAREEAARLGWREMWRILEVNQAEVERHLGLWAVAADRANRLLEELGKGEAPDVAAAAACTLAACRLALGDRRGAATALDRAAAHGGGQDAAFLLVQAALALAERTGESSERAVAALEAVAEGPVAPHQKALALARLAALTLEEGIAERGLALMEEATEAAAEGPREIREARVELLFVRARLQLAVGDVVAAGETLTKAVEEVGRQCVELDESLRRAFLDLPMHRQLTEEFGRVVGRTPGYAAGAAGAAAPRQALSEVLSATRRLSRAQGLSAAVSVALDAFLRQIPLQRGVLLVREEQRFVPMGGRRAGRAPLEPSAVTPDAAMLADMARVRRAVNEHEVRGSASPSRREFGGSYCTLAVPLCYGVSVVGAVWLEGTASAPPLDADGRLLLESLADQAAMAVQHHLQLDEIERLRRRAQADLTRTRAKLVVEAERRDQAERAAEAARRTIKLRYSYDQIVYGSRAMREVLAQVDRLVDRKITVLVNGESGTGKELVARALHYNGPRGSAAFVAINCGAIPQNLIESELFGHVRGAFTGAVKERRGHFELAHRGTLFLDEIGEIAPDVQVRLLRVLETGEVTPVGSSKRVKVDVRIVCATNRDLPTEVREGRFREDLFYRINAVTLRLPPLRERPEDIELLMAHFSAAFAKDRGEPEVRFPDEIRARFAAHRWPGNVRELRNVLEYATLFADDGVVPRDLALPF